MKSKQPPSLKPRTRKETWVCSCHISLLLQWGKISANILPMQAWKVRHLNCRRWWRMRNSQIHNIVKQCLAFCFINLSANNTNTWHCCNTKVQELPNFLLVILSNINNEQYYLTEIIYMYVYIYIYIYISYIVELLFRLISLLLQPQNNAAPRWPKYKMRELLVSITSSDCSTQCC